MSQLFLSNIPPNCPESEVQEWIETWGFPVVSIHIVRDQVNHASPAFAYVTLRDNSQNDEAIKVMNRRKLRERVMQVKMDCRGASDVAAASAGVRRTIKE